MLLDQGHLLAEKELFAFGENPIPDLLSFHFAHLTAHSVSFSSSGRRCVGRKGLRLLVL